MGADLDSVGFVLAIELLLKQHLDILLMIEVGYKYRFFGEDAKVRTCRLCFKIILMLCRSLVKNWELSAFKTATSSQLGFILIEKKFI